MKKIIMCLILMIGMKTYSQKYNVNWGEPLKMKKGTADLGIVSADKTGYYFLEKRMKMKLMAPVNYSYKLIKFDNSFEQEWDEDYNKELKGLDFTSIQALNDDLYIFATDYIKKEKTYKVFGTKINKSDGSLNSEFKELGAFIRESKKDDFEVKLSKQKDGKSLLLVSDLTSKDHSIIGVTLLDNGLKQKSNTIIELSYQPGFYDLQDVKMVGDRIVLLGKTFSEEIVKRKKKRKVFKSFALEIFDVKGTKVKSIPLDLESNFTLEGKLIELEGNEIAISGFYSKDAKKKNLNGFFIQKIDVNTGELTVNSTKEISTGLIGQNYSDDTDDTDDDDDKSSKKEKKKSNSDDDDDDEEFLNQFTIKSVDVNPLDGTMMIAAEISDVFLTSSTSYSPGSNGMPGRSSTTYTYHFTNKDILLICADKSGKIKWLNVVPKKQSESISTSRSGGMGLSISTTGGFGYFAQAGGMPYHSSFKSTFVNDKYVVVYNDNKNNDEAARHGDKIKSIRNFKKRGMMFGLNIDVNTGKMVKVPISSCADDDVITMPRHSYLINNVLIVPAWRLRNMGKTIFKIAKVTIK